MNTRWLGWIRWLGVVGVGFLSGCAVGPRSDPPALSRFEYEEAQMGLPFRIVLYASSRVEADRASQAAFRRIAELNSRLSDYEDTSETTILSKSGGTGREVSVGPDLWKVLRGSEAMVRRSGGAFDPTVGPLIQIWRRARREREMPKPEVVEEARRRTGFQKVILSSSKRTVRLTTPGMRLDFGGIAKGYAADEAIATLEKLGIRSALVSGGGDMTVSEPPPGQQGWKVEIGVPRPETAASKRFVYLRHQGLATSGDLFQYFEHEGVRYSHIVNPATGIGLTHRIQVTVIARTGMEADSLSTAVSVLGIEKGLKLVERTRGASASILRLDGPNMFLRDSTGFGKHLWNEPARERGRSE